MRVTRRAVLGLAGLTVFLPRPVAAGASPLELLRARVVGLPYYDYPRVRAELVDGARLFLRRQPDNPHDRRAIEVFTEAGAKLGYVPRSDNAALANLIDAGADIAGRAVRADRDRCPLWITVELMRVPAVFSVDAG